MVQNDILRARARSLKNVKLLYSVRVYVLFMVPPIEWHLGYRFWRRTLNPNSDPDPNPNPKTHRRTHPNPNRIFNRNQNKFFERKQRTEYDTEIKVNKELYL